MLSLLVHFNTVEWLHADGGPITTYSPIPVATSGMAVAQHEGLIYLIGGYTGTTAQITAQVHIFDIATDSWSSGAPLDTALHSPACGVVDDGATIYLLCALGIDATGSPDPTVQKLILGSASGPWEKLVDYSLSPIGASAVAAVDNGIFYLQVDDPTSPGKLKNIFWLDTNKVL